MNIISNNCVAAYIYKELLKEEYPHPFMWCYIYGKDFLSLIENYSSINFNDFELSNEGNVLSNNFYIKVGNVKLRYLHYYFDKNYKIPTLTGYNKTDVRYNKIWEYIVEKYTNRLKRFNQNEQPFIIWYDPHNKFNKELKQLPKICEKLCYKCMIFSNEKIELNNFCKQYPVKDKWVNEPGGWHDSFFKNYKDIILNELKSS